MSNPSNPGWATGYVPSSAEWNATWSGKVDYPASVSQGGTGGTTSAGAYYNLAQRQLLAASADIVPLTFYGIRTSVGAMTLTLPSLSLVQLGDWIELADIDFSAETNNVTITASGSDQIALYGGSATSQTLNIAGVRTTLVANTTSWRMLV